MLQTSPAKHCADETTSIGIECQRRPIDFDDGECDPDLEVRLYAEIYYSNESYWPDSESSIPNVRNVDTVRSSKETSAPNESLADRSSAPSNPENNLPRDDIDDRENRDIGSLYYPKSYSVFGEASESTRDREAIDRPPVVAKSVRRKQRQLSRKGLWLTRENSERDIRDDDPSGVVRTSTNREDDLTRDDSRALDNDGRNRRAKNSKRNAGKRACGKETLSRYDDADANVETDRYKVVSKKKKMKKKKRNAAPQVISSDSEDSIVEVPVPPKPAPLVIQLPDSEDDWSDDGSRRGKKSPGKRNNGSASSRDLREDSSTPDAPAKPPAVESDPSNEAARTATETADVSVEAARPEGVNLILNCTPIQRGASSLEEIRQMRETVPPIVTHSDDSMTESEATNWGNIAAGQSDATTNRDVCSVDVSNETVDNDARRVVAAEDLETCSVDLSNETENIQLWNQARHKMHAPAGIPMEISCTSGEGSTVDRTVANKDKTSSVSTISKEKTSSVSTISQEKTSSVSTISKEKTSSASTMSKEKTSSVTTINKETSSSVSTINKEKTSSVTTINKETTSDVSTINREKTSSVSTINREAAGARKRQKKAASTPFTDFDVPAIPRKRSKRLKDKAMSEYFFKPMSSELQAFYNNPWGGENMSLHDIQSKMSENPRCWGILDADLQGPNSKRRRACPRCHTDSHIGRRCPEKAKEVCCYMCGAKGHIESRCPHTMCLTCGRKYATYRPTCDYCCKLYCKICNGSGHRNDNCPDLWRRYHNTTSETIPIAPGDPSNIMKAPQFLCCCNCGRRGHDATTCQQLRWSQHFPTPMYVSSYTEGPFYESSNVEQMHYESSNPDEIQYESSNREKTQCPLPNVVRIDDVPHDGRIGYKNPNVDSPCVPQRRDTIKDATPSDDIEIVEVYDEPESPMTELENSVASSIVIFQSGDTFLPGPAFLREASWRLDKVKNIHLDGLLNGRVKPMFLRSWHKCFEFSLKITLGPNNAPRMTIEADSWMTLGCMEKVMMQWLSRTDDEKPNLEYDVFPYDDAKAMVANVKTKSLRLRTILEPTILWRKIVTLEESLKHIRAKYRRRPNQKKPPKRYEKNEHHIIHSTMKRRSQLVTSLYSRSWVKGGDVLVRLFKDIARKLITTNHISLNHYLEMIYLNNELFTFHTSAALSEALDNAILKSRRSESVTVPVANNPSVDTSVGKLQESFAEPRANVDVCEGNESPVHLSLEPTINNDTLSVDSSPVTPDGEQRVTVIEDARAQTDVQMPKVFGTTDETSVDSHTVRNPLFRPASVKGVVTQNAAPSPSSFKRKNVRPVGQKKVGDTKGLVRGLTKRNRKRYRMLAKQAIKSANLTNIPRLQEMAKALKLKIGNGSVTTDDVDTLHAAAGPTIHRSQYNDTYKKFLKCL